MSARTPASGCTILITSAGRRVGLIDCFRDSALALGLELTVIATDLDPAMAAACQFADLAFATPACSTPECTERLLEICASHAVDLLVPTIDTELPGLSLAAPRFLAAGTAVSISTPELVAISRDKLRTACILAAHGISTPRSGTIDDVMASAGSWRWPLIVRPRGGSSSIGVHLVASPDELADLRLPADAFAQEFERGEEYTVNLFFDRSGALRCAIPHLRREVRAGEVAKGITRRHPRLEELAWDLGRILQGARGTLCFQAIVNERGEPVVFEINGRFGGGYPLAHRAGGTFCRWLLEEVAGLPSSAHNGWQDGVVMLRYDRAVYRQEAAAR
jgi:carbamoyl-phosphate synthase large subunit